MVYTTISEDSPFVERVRAYAEIVRQDSSRALPMQFRAFWAQGEQLWGEEYNGNITFTNLWSNAVVVYRNHPTRPWEERSSYSLVWRNEDVYNPLKSPNAYPSFADPWGSPVERYTIVSPSRLLGWRAFDGNLVFAMADRRYAMWHAGVSRAIFNAPKLRSEMEIAFFARKPALDRPIFTYVATHGFTIPANGFRSRCRGFGDKARPRILKNGVPVGTAWISRTSSGITLDADTYFAPGDELAIDVTEGDRTKMYARTMTITIYAQADS